ncbi:MAG TPA: glycosyltransferase, partial [Methanospirillum sp.]|nr:glycosyltransferase [Methanospirillum sp.]
LIHCHNLHGYYFDLRLLPIISKDVVTILTLHDMWMFTGHCAHSFSCDLWKTGCQICPNPSIFEPLKRSDSPATNYERKRGLYEKSKFHIITPSQWLMDNVHQSILKPTIISSMVIPNGVDTHIFYPPENKGEIRKALGYSPNEWIILFTANGIRNNPWKDFNTMRKAIWMLSEDSCQPIRFIALGEDGPPELLGSAKMEFIPFIREQNNIARYYQAADIYIHATHTEVFGLTIIEAMACGLPVVATGVGGIPEIVVHDKTGILVPEEDAEGLYRGMKRLIDDDSLRRNMGDEGVKRVLARFTLKQQVEAYLGYYQRLLMGNQI